VDSGGRRIQGIVLAGSFPWNDSQLDRLRPRPLLPVALQPLISYTFRWLQTSGIEDAVVCLNHASRQVRDALEATEAERLRLVFHEDQMPRGPAGCVRDASLVSDADTFVVADSSAIPTVPLADVLETHRASGAVATVVVERENPREWSVRPSRPSGMYVFERRALEQVPAGGFQDIKENLIPHLYRAGEHVAAHVARLRAPRVRSAKTYVDANYLTVASLIERAEAPTGYVRCGEALVHASAHVHPSARLLGPVLVGPDCLLMQHATVVGPSVLGHGSTVAPDAVLARSVAWNAALVGPKAIVDGCILGDDVVIEPNTRLCGEIRVAVRRAEVLPRALAGRTTIRPYFGWWPKPETR